MLAEKSYSFALRIVKLYLHLNSSRKNFGPANQVLNSGTSVGANIQEAVGASSRKDFRARLKIAYREARETHYWLRLLRDSEILEPRLADSLLADCEELLKLLTSILNKLKDE